MAPGRVENAADVVSEGQEVKVRVTDVTPEGKIGLSMLFGADIKPESESRPSGGGGFTPRFGGGADRPRPSFGDRPRRPFGARTGSGGRSSGGGFGRGGGRDRGGRGGFDR